MCRTAGQVTRFYDCAKGGAPVCFRHPAPGLAGEDAGTVVVSVEYADLVTFAAEDRKVSADAEYQAWLKGLAKIRKIVSDSLYDELKP